MRKSTVIKQQKKRAHQEEEKEKEKEEEEVVVEEQNVAFVLNDSEVIITVRNDAPLKNAVHAFCIRTGIDRGNIDSLSSGGRIYMSDLDTKMEELFLFEPLEVRRASERSANAIPPSPVAPTLCAGHAEGQRGGFVHYGFRRWGVPQRFPDRRRARSL